MQACGRCKEQRVASEFTPSARLRGRGWCKPCHRAYQREWAQRNPEKIKAKSKQANARRLADPIKRAASYAASTRWNHALKAAAFRVLGDECKCCGESNALFLQIDHVHNDGAAHRKRLNIATRRGPSHQYRLYLEVRDGKTEGLQLLCANCNWGKARNRGICPHEEVRVARMVLCA